MSAKKRTNAKKPAKSAPNQVSLARTLGALVAAVGLRTGRGVVAFLKRINPPKERWQAWAASRRVRRVGTVLAGAAVMMLALGVMRSRLSAQERFQLDPARIELAAGDLSWLEGESAARMEAVIQGDLRNTLSKLSAASAFDDEFLGEVAAQLNSNPWVAGVQRIERYFPSEEANASLAVSLTIRKPVLVVEYGASLLLVDHKGVVLPYQMQLDSNGAPIGAADQILLTQELSRPLRRVVGMKGVRGQEPQAGKVWKNEQITAALSVESDLRKEGVGDIVKGISEIDLSDVEPVKNEFHQVDYEAGGGIVLKLDFTDAKVVWGKAAVHASTVEATSLQKIENLFEALGADPKLELAEAYYLDRVRAVSQG